MKKYSREDQRVMSGWAADCTERALPLFENARPGDDRPRRAINACPDTGGYTIGHDPPPETARQDFSCHPEWPGFLILQRFTPLHNNDRSVLSLIPLMDISLILHRIHTPSTMGKMKIVPLFFILSCLVLCSGCVSHTHITGNNDFNNTPIPTLSNPSTQFQQTDLDTAFVFAESYARAKYPDFWKTSPTRSVRIQNKKEIHHNWGDEYYFSWNEILYYTDINSSGYYEINGPGVISIIVNDTGQVKREGMLNSYNASEKQIKLTPDISEEQAWDVALTYFEGRGMKNILPLEISSLGLWIYDDSLNDLPWPKNGTQYLAWEFDVNHKQNYTMGGRIMVDAHDGHIINFNEIL